MKCPKCGYIGFEQTDRCRNCGYDFSLATQASPDDLALRRDEALGPLTDFDLGDAGPPATQTPPGRARRRHDPAFDPGVTPAAGALPLFLGNTLDDLPIVPTSEPTPPLAVRRAPSPLSRARTRTAPRSEPQPALVFVPGQAPDDEEMAEDDAPSALAPLSSRVAAALMDGAMLLAVDVVVLYFTIRICRLPAADVRLLPAAPLAAFFLLLNGGYLALFTGAGGQTIGQMAAGIRVVGDAGRVTPAQALARTLLLFLSLAPAGLGLLSVLFDRGRRGLHDRLTGTLVVRATGS